MIEKSEVGQVYCAPFLDGYTIERIFVRRIDELNRVWYHYLSGDLKGREFWQDVEVFERLGAKRMPIVLQELYKGD